MELTLLINWVDPRSLKVEKGGKGVKVTEMLCKKV